VRETIAAIRVLGFWRFVYARFFYRMVSRWAHKFNWHHMDICHPDGDTMHWCHWCGLRVVTKRREALAQIDLPGEG
jgi:hypothetical protein